MSETLTNSERYTIAVITDEADLFPEVRRQLGGEFRTLLAQTEEEIKSLLEQEELHAILFNLDCIGNGAGDGLDVLGEMRKIRDDVVTATFTRSTQRSIPLKASQVGADEFFLFPLNYDELKIVLSRAIEKRALELEGRRVIQQAESKAEVDSRGRPEFFEYLHESSLHERVVRGSEE